MRSKHASSVKKKTRTVQTRGFLRMHSAAKEAAPVSILHLSRRRDTTQRIRILRDNVIDLSVALDDLDVELSPRLAERARLEALLRDAASELASFVRRAA